MDGFAKNPPISQWLIAILLIVHASWATANIKDIENLLNNGQGVAAYQQAQELADEHMGEPAFDLPYGVAAMFANNLGQAVLAFERVLLVEPDNIDAHLYLGHCYYLLVQYPQAVSHLQFVINNSSEQEVVQQAQSLLTAASNKQQTKHINTSAYIEGSIGYDSNVNSASDADTITTFQGQFLANEAIKEQSAFYGQVNFGGHLQKSLVNDYRLVAGIDGKNRNNIGAHKFDLAAISGDIAISHADANNNLSFPLRVQKDYLDYNSYRLWYLAGVEWTRKLNQQDNLLVFAQGGVFEFSNASLQDTNYYLLGIGFAHEFAKQPLSWSAAAYVSDESANKSSGKHNGRYLVNGQAKLMWRMRPKVSSYGGVELQYSDHDANHPSFLKTREDTGFRGALGVVWQCLHNIALTTELSYKRNKSNIAIFDYHRWQALAKLRYDWQ